MKMKKPKLNLLDVIVVIVGCCSVGLAVYLKRTQGRLYLAELLYMGLFIVGYGSYRATRKKENSFRSEVQQK
jgi:hypothetical protein